MNLLNGLLAFFRTLLFGPPGARVQAKTRPATNGTAPVDRNVLVIVYNPRIPSRGGRRLTEALGWYDPQQLTQGYIADMLDASGGYVRYHVAETLDLDEWPLKADGFRYDESSYLQAVQTGSGFHQPDDLDYPRLLQDQHLVDRVETGGVDEVWLWGMPYAGFLESVMYGPGAYWCNGGPLPYQGAGTRRFIIMGFNYQRDVGEALHSFGHRAESILEHHWGAAAGPDNLWELFARREANTPGLAQVGNVHFAPNSTADYDIASVRQVQSACDDWLAFPNLPGNFRAVDCREWGCDERGHMRWWLKRIPHTSGQVKGKSANWWEYLVDPNVE